MRRSRNIIVAKPTSLRSTSFARSATSFICALAGNDVDYESNDVELSSQSEHNSNDVVPYGTNEKSDAKSIGFLVRETGLEPVRCEPHAPQTCASASSATLAYLSAPFSARYSIAQRAWFVNIIFKKISIFFYFIFLRDLYRY